MAAPQAGPGATYVLKDLDKEVGVETERLNGQYNLIRVCLGHNSAVPPEVDLSSVKTVLDIAAGTCFWLLATFYSKCVLSFYLVPRLTISTCMKRSSPASFPPKQWSNSLTVAMRLRAGVLQTSSICFRTCMGRPGLRGHLLMKIAHC